MSHDKVGKVCWINSERSKNHGQKGKIVHYNGGWKQQYTVELDTGKTITISTSSAQFTPVQESNSANKDVFYIKGAESDVAMSWKDVSKLATELTIKLQQPVEIVKVIAVTKLPRTVVDIENV